MINILLLNNLIKEHLKNLVQDQINQIKQENLYSWFDWFCKNTDFDNKLIKFYKKTTSNKIIDIEFKTKLDNLEKKG